MRLVDFMKPIQVSMFHPQNSMLRRNWMNIMMSYVGQKVKKKQRNKNTKDQVMAVVMRMMKALTFK
jgi:hypothetical protein